MEDPRTPIEQLIDNLDSIIISLNDLKKFLFKILDLLPDSANNKH